MDEADTRSSMLLEARAERADEKWLYYREPVQRYLRGLGCAEQDLEDLTHDILVRLHTYIVAGYDRSRAFRPYFKTAIRNLYFDHLRTHPKPETLDSSAAVAEERLEDRDLAPLVAYARIVYGQFAGEVTGQDAKDCTLLHAWLVEGVTQDEMARRRGQTGRHMRKCLGRAADRLAEWMHARMNDGDLADLATLARRHGADLDLRGNALRDLFRHLSQAKRMRVLVVLAYLHRQRPTDGIGSSR